MQVIFTESRHASAAGETFCIDACIQDNMPNWDDRRENLRPQSTSHNDNLGERCRHAILPNDICIKGAGEPLLADQKHIDCT
jgi:hypothetical protein